MPRFSVVIDREVSLTNPVVVVGLSGYTDAGGVATYSISYVRRKLGAQRIGRIPGEFFCDYSTSRPTTTILGGVVEDLRMPDNIVYASERDNVVLVEGFEPNLNWLDFIDALLELAKRFGAKRLYAIGGMIDNVEEPKVSAVISSPRLREEMLRNGVDLIDYRGPCSMYTPLMRLCDQRGVEGVSIWGHVPYRFFAAIAQLGVADAITAKAVLEKLVRLSGISLDLSDVERQEQQLRSMIRSMKPPRTLEKKISPDEFPAYIL